jgi:hypothetical protein
MYHWRRSGARSDLPVGLFTEEMLCGSKRVSKREQAGDGKIFRGGVIFSKKVRQ